MPTTKTATAATAESTARKTSDGPDPVIIDLGSQKRKRIKQLRKGRGKLLRDIEDATRELSAQGVVAAGAQPVIVLVREKALEGLF